MVRRADVVAPQWKSEVHAVPGLIESGEPVSVTIQWLDAGARWRLASSEADPELRLFDAVAAVVMADDGKPLMDGPGWRAWSTRVSNADCVALLDVALQAAGMSGDAEKK